MSVRTDVLLWAQRVLARKAAPAYQILEITPTATLDEAQAALHKIARLGHPDLHRTNLSPDELELVTSAYARTTAAYQEFRLAKASTTRMRPISGSDPSLVPPTMVIPTSASPHKAVSVPDGKHASPDRSTQPVQTQAPAMSAKAALYYRKAELCLKRGELTSAILQLKMAIVSDPQSQFLRTALSEIEAEVAKK